MLKREGAKLIILITGDDDEEEDGEEEDGEEESESEAAEGEGN